MKHNKDLEAQLRDEKSEVEKLRNTIVRLKRQKAEDNEVIQKLEQELKVNYCFIIL